MTQAGHGDEAAVAHTEQGDDAAVAQAEQGDDGADLGAADLQDAGGDDSESADQEPGGATKCAYCGEPFSSADPPVMKDGCQSASNCDPRLEGALRGGRLGGNRVTGVPAFEGWKP